MRITIALAAAALFGLACASARAQAANQCLGTVEPGGVCAVSLGNASTPILGGGNRGILAVDNESTTATIACAFGITAVLNSAGSWTIPPGVTRVFDVFPPSDQLNCIASGAATPVTAYAR